MQMIAMATNIRGQQAQSPSPATSVFVTRLLLANLCPSAGAISCEGSRSEGCRSAPDSRRCPGPMQLCIPLGVPASRRRGRGGRLGCCASNHRAPFVVRDSAIARSASIRDQEDSDTSRLIVRRQIASSVDLRGYWIQSLRYFRSNAHCLKIIRVADPCESRSGAPRA